MLNYKPLTLEQFMWIAIGVAMLLMTVCGCGARKVQTDVFKASETTKEQSDSQGQVKKESGSEVTKSSVQANNTVDEKQEQKITELYDINGKLQSRITELVNSKKTDNSTKTKNKTQVRYMNTDSVFNNTVYRTRTVTVKEKVKETDANNNSLYWTLGVLGFFAIAAVFLYFYLRKQ